MRARVGAKGQPGQRRAAVVARGQRPGARQAVHFLGLGRLKQVFSRNKGNGPSADGVFPVSEAAAEIIREVNADKFVNEEGRVEWDGKKRNFIQVKEGEKKLNNFEKTKLKKNPVELMRNAKQLMKWMKTPFEELDSKENAEDIDIRLKWFGLFHRRKQQYGKFMMRLKLPNGVVTSDQLRTLAAITEEAGEGGCGDITTRQNFQLRGIALHDVPDIFERLAACRLTTIQSGMDNVRNAVGSPLAGIDPLEIVDTIPACNDLTE